MLILRFVIVYSFLWDSGRGGQFQSDSTKINVGVVPFRKYCAHANLCTCTLSHMFPTAESSASGCSLFTPFPVRVFVCVLLHGIIRWLLVYSGMRKRWSPTHCLQGWSRASYIASAPLAVVRGRLFSSRSWSSTSDGLSPTTLSCSAACSRSELGRNKVRFRMVELLPLTTLSYFVKQDYLIQYLHFAVILLLLWAH